MYASCSIMMKYDDDDDDDDDEKEQERDSEGNRNLRTHYLTKYRPTDKN